MLKRVGSCVNILEKRFLSHEEMEENSHMTMKSPNPQTCLEVVFWAPKQVCRSLSLSFLLAKRSIPIDPLRSPCNSTTKNVNPEYMWAKKVLYAALTRIYSIDCALPRAHFLCTPDRGCR
jgi:hypothetical protein